MNPIRWSHIGCDRERDMIRAIDKLFIKAGLEAKELKASRYRGALYFGIFVMLGLTALFTGLAIRG